MTLKGEGHLPGGPIDSSHLYETKLGDGGKQLGTKDLRGVWHPFNDGETIEFHSLEGVTDRIPIIKTRDGEKIPFETWVSRQENK